MQAIVYIALALAGSVGVWYAGDGSSVRALGQLPTFVVIYEPGPLWQRDVAPEHQVGIRDHGGYLKRLFDEGVMQSAGPLDGGGGMVVIRAQDEAAARAVVEEDPGVQSGLIVLDKLLRWYPRRWSDD